MSTTAQQIQALIQGDTQTRFAQVQVFRNGSWVTVPVQSLKANVGNSKSGKVDIKLPEDISDLARCQLYEGERIRMFRGVVGAPPQRCWTGFVDTREPTRDSSGLSRNVSVTDYIKELNDAISLDGVVYDNWAPNDVCIDVISRAIKTQQFIPFDDNGNPISNLASYTQAGANPLVYFPSIFNDDGSTFILPSGTLGSFTGVPATSGMATFVIPTASGMGNLNYSAFELPNRYIIASTLAMPGWTQVSNTAFPPAAGQFIFDAYNGIMYFNAANASNTVSFTATYFDAPLFDFPAGTKAGDIITQVLDKTGARWKVDGSGLLSMIYQDTIVAPKKIYNPSQYVSMGVQINRDRRNVIVCLGWDGNCGGILAAKAVNIDDINNAPPVGLGKRAYLVVQDQTWKTQYAVSKAVYYAIQQLSRRGKIAALAIVDDPTLSLDDVLAFESGLSEISTSDFFYVDNLTWSFQADGPQTEAMMQVSGTLLPGKGTVYFGPISGVTAYGAFDYTADVMPITGCALSFAPNLYANSDSLSGTTLSGMTLNPTGSPSGHASAELLGTGSPSGTNPNTARTLPVPIGVPTTLSHYIDLSHVVADSGRRIGFFDVTGFGEFIEFDPAIGTSARQGVTYTFAQNLVADDLSTWTKVNAPTTGTTLATPSVLLTAGNQTATSPAIPVTPGSKISMGCLYAGGVVSAGTVLVSFLDQTGTIIPGTGFSNGSGYNRKILANFTVPAGVTSIRIKVDGNGATISGTYSICGFTIVNGAVGAEAWLSATTPVSQMIAQIINPTITAGQKLSISEPMLRTDGVVGPYIGSGVQIPVGGSYEQTFSIAAGLNLTYTIGANPVNEWIDIYGSDGSHIIAESNVLRSASQTLTLPMPVGLMTAGVMYVFRLWVKDSNGAIGVFRNFVTVRA